MEACKPVTLTLIMLLVLIAKNGPKIKSFQELSSDKRILLRTKSCRRSHNIIKQQRHQTCGFLPNLSQSTRCRLTLSPVHHAAIGLVHPSQGISIRFARFIFAVSLTETQKNVAQLRI